MKLVKTIAIITLSVMLTLSVSLNIFIITLLEIEDVDSFKQVLLCRELMDSMSQLQGDAENTSKPVDTTQPETPNTETEIPNIIDKAPTDAEVIYNENGVKISYVEQELGLMGPSLKFYVENNTDQTLDICLTNIYIDGFKAEYCGMYCSELGAGKKAYESLTLWESDYEDFSEFPSVIEFVVKIQDSTSWNTLVETEPMYICLD
jgi:hypothetical protein